MIKLTKQDQSKPLEFPMLATCDNKRIAIWFSEKEGYYFDCTPNENQPRNFNLWTPLPIGTKITLEQI